MATNAISSATNAPPSVQQPQADAAKKAASNAGKEARAQPQQKAQEPKPVTNAQGQVTGRTINVTA